jgi:hypothetical protein
LHGRRESSPQPEAMASGQTTIVHRADGPEGMRRTADLFSKPARGDSPRTATING